MPELLSALVTITAALDGLVVFITFLGHLFSILRWNKSIYDVIDTLYEASKNPALRKTIKSIHGGKEFLAAMRESEGDAKKAAKAADITRDKVMRLAYTCKIIWLARKQHAIIAKEQERENERTKPE